MNSTDTTIFALLLINMFLIFLIIRNTAVEDYCNCRTYKYNMGSSASDEELGHVYGDRQSVQKYTHNCNIPDYLVGVL